MTSSWTGCRMVIRPNTSPPHLRSGRRDVVSATSLADLVTYLPGDLCHKIDMATMAHGLECRQPMLDHRLVELAAAMPSHLKMRRGRGKWILERAFRKTTTALSFPSQKDGLRCAA